MSEMWGILKDNQKHIALHRGSFDRVWQISNENISLKI